MDDSLIKKFEIEKFEKDHQHYKEETILSHLFQVSSTSIRELLNYGFVYDYENGWFVTKLEINNNTHLVWITKYSNEEKGIRRYKLSFQTFNGIELKGASDFYLYCDISRDYGFSLDTSAFLFHIHNVYKLNHVESEPKGKETFKQFVESEKTVM